MWIVQNLRESLRMTHSHYFYVYIMWSVLKCLTCLGMFWVCSWVLIIGSHCVQCAVPACRSLCSEAISRHWGHPPEMVCGSSHRSLKEFFQDGCQERTRLPFPPFPWLLFPSCVFPIMQKSVAPLWYLPQVLCQSWDSEQLARFHYTVIHY